MIQITNGLRQRPTRLEGTLVKQTNIRLKIIQINIRHWTNNRHLLANWTLNTERPDILLLNKTSVTDNKQIKIVGYNTYTSPQGRNCGAAILIKRSIIHHQVHTNKDSFLACKIQTDNGPIIITTTYAPPRETLNLHAPFHALKNYNLPLFFLGDLNANHTLFGSNTTNESGRHLLTITQRYQLEHLGPNFFTFFNNRSKTTPDIILRNRLAIHLNYHATPGPTLLSDHRPIILTLSSNPILIPSPI